MMNLKEDSARPYQPQRRAHDVNNKQQEVVETWANGQELTEEEKKYIEILRLAGCTCDLPLLGYIPQQGPRCRMCGAEGAYHEQTR